MISVTPLVFAAMHLLRACSLSLDTSDNHSLLGRLVARDTLGVLGCNVVAHSAICAFKVKASMSGAGGGLWN